MTPEPFVSAEKAADFLDISRRHLLALARKGIAGAYPVDACARRKTRVFRLSELVAAIAGIPLPEAIQSRANRVDARSARPQRTLQRWCSGARPAWSWSGCRSASSCRSPWSASPRPNSSACHQPIRSHSLAPPLSSRWRRRSGARSLPLALPEWIRR